MNEKDEFVDRAVEVLTRRDGFTPDAARRDLETVAEELGVPVSDVAATVADTAGTPAEGPPEL